MTSEERFERIEKTLDRIGDRMDQITVSHLELEAAQKNTQKLLDRFIEESTTRGRDVDERIANLTILVDRLVERDLGRSNGGI